MPNERRAYSLFPEGPLYPWYTNPEHPSPPSLTSVRCVTDKLPRTGIVWESMGSLRAVSLATGIGLPS